MKKLSVLFQIFIIAICTTDLKASWESPPLYFYPDASYDYVRVKPYTAIDLKEGDIAWVKNGASNTFSVQLDIPEKDVYNYSHYAMSSGFTQLVIGPCTIHNGQYYLNLKIDRQERRQNIYTAKVLVRGENLVLNDGDHAWYVEAFGNDESIEITYPDGSTETRNSAHDSQIYGPSQTNIMGDIAYFIIRKSANTGSKSLRYDEDSGYYVYPDGTQTSYEYNYAPDPTNINYDQLLGWCYFTDTPWFYSYTNGSWYFMHSLPDGIYVWNANLPNNGWMKLHG